MTDCRDVLNALESRSGGPLPEDLARHLDGCSSCRLAAERRWGLAEGARLLQGVQASPELIARLKTLTRLNPACEEAVALLEDALAGSLDGASRSRFLGHLHHCAGCRNAWESLATLRQVGRATAAPPRLRANLAIHPTLRVAVRRRSRWIPDLRLAAAAAYVLAGLTVLLAGSPVGWSWLEGSRVERTAFFARAAVENRITWLSRQAQEHLAVAGDRALGAAEDLAERARRVFADQPENPAPPSRVTEGGNGGSA